MKKKLFAVFAATALLAIGCSNNPAANTNTQTGLSAVTEMNSEVKSFGDSTTASQNAATDNR
jgi:outer membrane murein-binding lipoprotein Lpp